MNLFFDFTNMMADAVGKNGVASESFAKRGKEIADAYEKVRKNRGAGAYEWCTLPYKSTENLEEIKAYGKFIRNDAESFVLFGIGGSALGPLSVASSLLHLRHNEIPKESRRGPKFFVEDNIDPERMNSLLDVIKTEKAYYNFVSKSGETSETLAQFLVMYKLLKEALGDNEARRRITITTTHGRGALYEIAQKERLKTFDIESGVGGRFSVFSNVGLIPFAVLGLDIVQMLAGAKSMDKACLLGEIEKNPALMSAFLHIELMKKGKSMSVMMPYADSLRYMSDFYAQLWGESLGKSLTLDGSPVKYHQTPIKAIGVTDQHSQIQLYVEGARDKVVTFIGTDRYRSEINIPHDKNMEHGLFLMGNTLNKLIDSERMATAFSLTKSGCPNGTIMLPEINENSIGQLITYFMYKTAYAGALMNIDTFNQPGVEEGKKATFAILGRKGYEDKLSEIVSQQQNKYIIAGERNE